MVWGVKKLGEVCGISTGNSNTEDAIENGPYAFFDRSKIVKKSSKYLFDCDAIIIAGEGQTFMPKFYSGKFDLHQRAYALFNFNKDVNINYVYKYLIHFHKYFEEVAVGATAKSLRLRHFQDLPIPIPPLSIQKQIVAILDKSFEEIAKAKENAEKNLKNAKELFESHLQSVFENKGKGWEEKKLGEVCEMINRGISPKYVESDGVCVLNQKCIRDHKINFELSRLHDLKNKKVSEDRFIQIGDVLVNSTGTGTLGRVAQVEELLTQTTVDSHVTIVRPIKGKFYNKFFGYALMLIEKEIAKKGEGCGGQTELARDTLKNDFTIYYPKSITEQKHIVDKLDATSIETKKLSEIYQQKLRDLEELKKSILQKAFNGELIKE